MVAELLRVFLVFGRSYVFSGLTPHLRGTGVGKRFLPPTAALPGCHRLYAAAEKCGG